MPGMSQETSWTLVNLSYMAGSYLMFHYVRGVPFDFNAGAFDNLNMWEQIDNGDQYTPAKKFLLSVPIVLFLVSDILRSELPGHIGRRCAQVAFGMFLSIMSCDCTDVLPSSIGYDSPSSTLRPTTRSRTISY
jgi:hypothetical protein